jgi:D-alanyl-D-alanine carboxypeptidase
MKLAENIEASAWEAISVLKTRSLFTPGQQIRLAVAVAILVMLASAESLSAQPITGTAATKPLNPKELDGYFADQLSHKPFVGISVGVVQGGKMVFCKGYGYACKETKRPTDNNTRFAVASVTKEFTAACILLSEEGKLSVYDPVAKYLPDLTRAQDVRLLDLMNMVSGYRDCYPLDFLLREQTQSTTPDAVVDEYAKQALDFEPGSRFSYSNTNYLILGRVVEKVSGKSYEEFLLEQILEPLGLIHSGFETDPVGSEAAQGYGSLIVSDPQPVPREAAGWMFSAGALYASPSDVVTWDLALMSGKILTPKSYRLMTTVRLRTNGVGTGYGYGLAIKEVNGQIVLSHSGGANGFRAFNEFVPSTQSAFCITMNSDNVSKDELIKHVEPLLLPAVTKGPVPTIAGPEPLTIATQLFAAFQQGKIDRSLLGSDFDAFLTPERLEAASASFRELGEPKSVKLLSTVERGGMAYSELEFEFEKAGFLGDLYRTPDGKVQEFLLFAK